MTGFELFQKRLNQHYRFYKRLKAVTIDWTVWVYIFIPFFIVGVSVYIDLWNEVPTWPEFLTIDYLFMFFVLYIFTSQYYSFLYPADVLYLWQKRRLIQTLSKMSIVYMALVQLLKMSLFLAILSPLVIKYLGLSLQAFFELSVLVYLLLIIMVILKRKAKVGLSKWKFRFTFFTLISITYMMLYINLWLNFWIVLGFVSSVMVSLFIIMISKCKNLEREISLDVDQRNKVSQLVLMQAAHIGAPDWMTQSNSPSSSRPWIYRKSQKIYPGYTPENAYQELIIKTFLRRRNWMFMYLQFTFVGVGLLILFPSWYKVLIYFILIFIIVQLARSYWNQIMSAQFLDLFKWRVVDLSNVSQKMFKLFLLPSFLILSLILGYTLFSFMGIIVMIVVGLAVTRITANLLSQKVIIELER